MAPRLEPSAATRVGTLRSLGTLVAGEGGSEFDALEGDELAMVVPGLAISTAGLAAGVAAGVAAIAWRPIPI